MCLKNVDFALVFDDGLKEYVGYGWKAGLTVPKIKTWYKASGSRYNGHKPSDNNRINLETGFGEDKPHKEYPLGFHIFLNEEDAKNYFTCDKVYRVAFSEVLAYGNNLTSNNNSGPCVIANHIYYLGNTPKSAEEDAWYDLYRDDCDCTNCEEFREKYNL